MQTKVVILNGPPSSGKDTLTDEMVKYYADNNIPCHHLRFKTKLYDLVQCVYSLTDEDMQHLKINKEVPNTKLDGLSFRQSLIKVSEEVIKPNYGKNYFGISAAKAVKPGINIFSDGGFNEELDDLVKKVGTTNIILVRLYRQETSFEGDSRTYIYPQHLGIASFDFENRFDIEKSTEYLLDALKGFIEG